jgi:hypothetical protein
LPAFDSAYDDYLHNKEWLAQFSGGDSASLDRLIFQDMVLNNLTPEEQQQYMQFLLEPRPKTPAELKYRNTRLPM